MAALRWWIEKEDGSGFLLPVGADETSEGSVYQKTASTPYWEGDNPPLLLNFTGVATNQNASPTTAQVVTAIEAFNTFGTTNDQIASVQLIEYDGDASEAMGAALGAIPGAATVRRTILPAYTSQGFEIVEFEYQDIVFPHNFTFEMRISNIYINGAGGGSSAQDIGDLVAANADISRITANGVETSTVAASVTLRNKSQARRAIEMMIVIATGLSVSFAEYFGSNGTTSEAANKVKISNPFNSAQVEMVSMAYDPVTLQFSGRVTASRPAATRAPGFELARGVNVNGTVSIDDGVSKTRIKAGGGGRNYPGAVYQKGHNTEATVEVGIQIVGFRSELASISPKDGNDSNQQFRQQIGKILEPILKIVKDSEFVEFPRKYGRGTGNITPEGVEGGNTRTVTLTFVGVEEHKSSRRTRTPGEAGLLPTGDGIEARALAILNHISLNAVLAADSSLQTLDDLFVEEG